MTENGELRTKEGGNAVDTILSSLPRHIIDIILDGLPIRDAARTSVLSSNWRYVWAEHPSLVLNKKFSKELLQNRSNIQFDSYFANIVNRVLFQHRGFISKFVIDISDLSSARYSDIDMWLSFLSRNGIRELILHNGPSEPYKIPCYIFSIPFLTYLELSNCTLKVPNNFQGFNKLNNLFLRETTIQNSVCISTPVLTNLTIILCRGICNLNIFAPSLMTLFLCDNVDANFYPYVNCSHMKYASITLSKGVENFGDCGTINLTALLGCWPKVKSILLDGLFLKYLVAGTLLEEFPITLECLILHQFIRIKFDLDQIVGIVFLLSSSPVLQELHLWTDRDVSDDVKVSNYLEETIHRKPFIGQLCTVKMRFFKGARAELLFLKFLLCCSPSLETIFIEELKTLGLGERLRISEELNKFPRLSQKSKIVILRK